MNRQFELFVYSENILYCNKQQDGVFLLNLPSLELCWAQERATCNIIILLRLLYILLLDTVLMDFTQFLDIQYDGCVDKNY